MTRQRQVFPRETVAHMWAHKAQDSARDAQGSFFFTGPTIYSYGSHFAMAHILSEECGAKLGGRVLLNDESRSNTTSKHQSIMRQALTRQQREDALSLPRMDQDTARSIESALREKRLPDACVQLLQKVRDNIGALSGKKHGSGTFAHHLHMASRYEKTALAFYERAGKKYPLPPVPAMSDVPVENGARDGFLLQFIRADLECKFKANITHARDGLKLAQEAIANPDASAVWYRHSHNTTCARDCALRAIASAKSAANIFKQLHGAGKKSRIAAQLIKSLAAAADVLNERVRAAEKEEQREKHEREIKRYAWAHHHVKAGSTAYRHVNALQETVYRASPGFVQSAIDTGVTPTLIATAHKMARANSYDSLQREASRAMDWIKIGDSFWDSLQRGASHVAGDVLREYKKALQKFAYIQTIAAQESVTPAALRHHTGALSDAIERARERAAEIQANIERINAQVITDWINGASNVRPDYDAGTYARINSARGIVETTRGATVPIEHACRLARMYAVTVRRGGAEWRDGAGPMVGHYRVNKIGADGSLIIGCHEFTPSEAQRLHDVLASCKECEQVTAITE